MDARGFLFVVLPAFAFACSQEKPAATSDDVAVIIATPLGDAGAPPIVLTEPTSSPPPPPKPPPRELDPDEAEVAGMKNASCRDAYGRVKRCLLRTRDEASTEQLMKAIKRMFESVAEDDPHSVCDQITTALRAQQPDCDL